MEFHLNDLVYVIDTITEATPACATCGQPRFESRYVIVEAEISEIFTHLSATDEPVFKYRVRTDDELRNLTWHEEGQTLFGHLGAAEDKLAELERGLQND